MPIAPQIYLPPVYQRPFPRRRRGGSLMRLGAFGLAPVDSTGSRRICPAWGCYGPLPVRNRPIADAPATTAGTPVPATFPTNQIFVNADGSQWMFSAAQGKWINVGTPFNVNAPSATTPASAAPPVPTSPTAAAAAGTPVNVSVAAPTASTSTYDSLISFATQDSLISGIPNWILGVGLFFASKAIERTGRR